MIHSAPHPWWRTYTHVNPSHFPCLLDSHSLIPIKTHHPFLFFRPPLPLNHPGSLKLNIIGFPVVAEWDSYILVDVPLVFLPANSRQSWQFWPAGEWQPARLREAFGADVAAGAGMPVEPWLLNPRWLMIVGDNDNSNTSNHNNSNNNKNNNNNKKQNNKHNTHYD